MTWLVFHKPSSATEVKFTQLWLRSSLTSVVIIWSLAEAVYHGRFTVTSCFRVLQLWSLLSSGISHLCCYSDTTAFCLATDNHLTITRNTWIKVKYWVFLGGTLFLGVRFFAFFVGVEITSCSYVEKISTFGALKCVLKLSVFFTLHVCSRRRVHLELIVSLTRSPCPIRKIRFLSTRDKMKMVQ